MSTIRTLLRYVGAAALGTIVPFVTPTQFPGRKVLLIGLGACLNFLIVLGADALKRRGFNILGPVNKSWIGKWAIVACSLLVQPIVLASVLPFLFIPYYLVSCFIETSVHRGTPQKYPYAFERLPDDAVTYFDVDEKKFTNHQYFRYGTETISKVQYGGIVFKLTEPAEAEKVEKLLTKIGGDRSLLLPVKGNIQQVIGASPILLSSGKILLVGGDILPEGQHWLIPSSSALGIKGNIVSPTLDNTWIFDPKANTVREGQDCHHHRRGFSVTRLKDGRFLLAGGWTGSSVCPVADAEIYDPSANTFTDLSSMCVPRYDHTVVQLNNGKVLIAGGKTGASNSDSGRALTSTAEVLDLSSKRFTLVGQLHDARYNASAFPVGNDTALVCWGETDEVDTTHHVAETVWSAELYTGVPPSISHATPSNRH